MNILVADNICKSYSAFQLKNVSFCVKKGSIMGFIGRNGAGKTTTLKIIMNMVHMTHGRVEIFGMDMAENESIIKQRIGYACGVVDYYKRKKIKKLLDITERFYDNWDHAACRKYMELFDLDENKTPCELSDGMKVKLNLAVSLSHKAELLILDEPTSGLDPVSRAELLEIFAYLKEQGVSVLFSTHITSDLDQCADDITYIRDGQIIYTGMAAGFSEGKTLEEAMLLHEKKALNEKFTL